MKYLFIIAALVLLGSTAHSQDTTDSVATSLTKITLRDGTSYVGTIVKEDADAVVILLINNTRVEIPSREIEKRAMAEGTVVRGQFMRSDPNDSRTFFAPTAKTIKQGSAYFAVYELFVPFIGFGITDDIMVAAGTPALPMAAFRFYYFGAKARFLDLKNVDAAVGFTYSALPFDDDDLNFGLGYAVATFGTERAAATVGYGTNVTKMDERVHMLMLSGEIQTSNSVKFITENWISLNGGSGIASLGLRFFNDNLAGDFGLLIPTEQGGSSLIFLPWVGLAYNFGR